MSTRDVRTLCYTIIRFFDRDGSGPNTFDPSEFPSLGGGGGGQGMPGRPNYGKLARTHSRQLDLGGRDRPSK